MDATTAESGGQPPLGACRTLDAADLNSVKSFFAQDKYAAQTTGIEILEAGKGYAKVQLKVEERHKNAIGIVMGAVYFTMADFAFAVATNSSPESGRATVTLSSQINFIAASKSGTLYAEARAKKEGRTAVFYEVSVYELEKGERRTVASTSITGFRLGN